jgi:hypothetical protein
VNLRIVSVGADRNGVLLWIFDGDENLGAAHVKHEEAFKLLGEIHRAIRFPEAS